MLWSARRRNERHSSIRFAFSANKRDREEAGPLSCGGKIGSGAFGEVYRAHDLHLERDVALKILRSGFIADNAARKQFRREALVLSKLNHPNVATVFDFDTHEDMDFLAMELIHGTPLST